MTDQDALRKRLLDKAAGNQTNNANSTLHVSINSPVRPDLTTLQQMKDPLLADDLFEGMPAEMPSPVTPPPIRQPGRPNPTPPISPMHPQPFSQPTQPSYNPAQGSLSDSSIGSMGEDIEDFGDDFDEDSEQSDVSKLGEEITSDNTKDAAKKYIAFAVLILFVIVIIVAAIGRGAQKEHTTHKSPSSQSASSQRLYNESVNYSSDFYTDSIIVNKYMKLEDGVVNCYFEGTLREYGKDVAFLISPDEYNSYDNGDTIDVSYHIAKFGGKIYCADFKIIG